MGNFLNKNKSQNNKSKEKEQNEKIKSNPFSKSNEKEKLININLINKQAHSKQKDAIIEVICLPNLENAIIIGTRFGDIKEIFQITTKHNIQDYSNILLLYSCSKILYSLILLENNNICLGLSDEILILKFNNEKKDILDKQNGEKILDLSIPSEGPIHSLLELKNGNIISAGKNIILWVKHSSLEYKEANKIPIGNSRIINLVEFIFYNTILASQENTHQIHIFKNNKNSLSLIKTIENVPSLGYKGSCQKFSKNCMLLIGKFELNMIDL